MAKAAFVDGWYTFISNGRKPARRSLASYERSKERARQWHIDHPERTRIHKSNYKKRHLWDAYGLTPQNYADLLQSQGGVCAVCGNDDPRFRLSVDHDHATGRVRGLLCNTCNRAMGLFGDDSVRLRRAIAYLGGLP